MFYSELELVEQNLSKSIDIIISNFSQEISPNITAYQLIVIFAHSNPEVHAVQVSSEDQGKNWCIKVCDVPWAFTA